MFPPTFKSEKAVVKESEEAVMKMLDEYVVKVEKSRKSLDISYPEL